MLWRGAGERLWYPIQPQLYLALGLGALGLKVGNGGHRCLDRLSRYGKEILGEAPKVEGVPLYTDARLYAEAGIPTVSYGAGPRSFLEANGHRADENLKLSDLTAATSIVALAVADILVE